MHLVQHFIISWFISEGGRCKAPADRRIITWSGCLPDIDVLPFVGAMAYNIFTSDLPFAQAINKAHDNIHLSFHHKYTHGFLFAIITGLGVWILCKTRKKTKDRAPPESSYESNRRSLKVSLLSMLAVIVHCFCDLIATQSPITPFWPFSNLEWQFSWAPSLLEWPNTVMLILFIIIARQYAVKKRRSPLEAISIKLEKKFIKSHHP